MSADTLKEPGQFPRSWHTLLASCLERPGVWRFAEFAPFDQLGRGSAYTKIRRLARRWRQFSNSLIAVGGLPPGLCVRTRIDIDNEGKSVNLEIAVMQKTARMSTEKLLEEGGFSNLPGVDSPLGGD